VNPAGKIELKAGDAGLSGGQLNFSGPTPIVTLPSFSALKELIIGAGASFRAVDTDTSSNFPIKVTFESLTKLTVDGTLNVDSDAISFAELQNKIGAATDVSGNGSAVFSGWGVIGGVDGVTIGHAFDQILGIKDVTVASITTVPNTSGFSQITTPDRATTSGTDYKLRVLNSITAPVGGLTIDRDLYVAGAINFGVLAAYPITIGQGIGVYAGNALTLGGSDQTVAVLNSTGTNATLTAGSGQFSNSAALTLRAGDALQIPGKLLINAGTFKVGAPAANEISLSANAATFIEKGAVSSATPTAAGVSTATITVNAGGTLSVGAASSVGTGSGVEVKKGGKISTNGVNLIFSNTVQLGGTGTLTATGDGSIFNKTATRDITGVATPVQFNTTEVSGDFTLSGGTLGQTVTTAAANSAGPHNEFDLKGSIKVLRGLTEYDYTKLEAALLNGVSFDATTGATGGTISIPTSGTLGQKVGLGGTFETAGNAKLTTGGAGALSFGTASLKTNAGTTNSLNLTGVILAPNTIRGGALNLSSGSLATGTTALTLDQASLTLSGSAKLSLGAVLNVGTGNPTTASNVTVNGNAAIEFTASTTTIVLLAPTTGPSSTLNLDSSSYVVTGGALIGSVTGNIIIPNEPVAALRANDLYGAITDGNANTTNLPATATGFGMAITNSGANIQIAGAAGKFINADSKVYSTNE
jgi:filamentous hemagglutinin